jgi:ribose/xylose/arabinose/galactoside ABC-type transport system permease subunit
MTQTAVTTPGRKPRRMPLLFQFRSGGVLAVLLLLVAGSAILTPHHTFVGPANLRTLFALGSEFGVMALGVGILMIAGEFDLSVGSILALTAFVFSTVLAGTGHALLAVLAALVVGLALGVLNGVIVVRGHVVSFIATLGTMLSLRGLTEILSGGTVLTVPVAEHPVFLQVFTGDLFGIIPAQFIWFLFGAVILYFLLGRSGFGNWIYATGDSKQAARAMGVRTGLTKIICFALVGFLCAFAAVLQTARLTAFSVHMGEGWELRAVAAAVIGGTSLQGGRGSMLGIFLGTLVILVVNNMISQLRLAYEYTYIAFGLVILAGVLIDLWIEKQSQRAATASEQ